MGKKTFAIDTDIKIGIESNILEGEARGITFAEPFKNTPKIFLTVNDSLTRHCHVQVTFSTANGFIIRIVKTQDGTAASRRVMWLAMDYESDSVLSHDKT